MPLMSHFLRIFTVVRAAQNAAHVQTTHAGWYDNVFSGHHPTFARSSTDHQPIIIIRSSSDHYQITIRYSTNHQLIIIGFLIGTSSDLSAALRLASRHGLEPVEYTEPNVLMWNGYSLAFHDHLHSIAPAFWTAFAVSFCTVHRRVRRDDFACQQRHLFSRRFSEDQQHASRRLQRPL